MLSLSKIWTLPSRGQCWVYFTGSDIVPLLLLAAAMRCFAPAEDVYISQMQDTDTFHWMQSLNSWHKVRLFMCFQSVTNESSSICQKNLGRGKGGAHRWTTAVPWVYWLCQNVTSFLHGNSCLFARKILRALTTWSWQLLRCADVNSAL